MPPASSSPRAVAIRHLAFEDLGILEPLLVERGYAVEYREAGLDELAADAVGAADVLVVLGGPIGVGDVDRYPFLAEELDVITSRLAAGRPVLGVCLGAQLSAAALGARVAPTGRVEIGYAPLSLTAEGLGSPLAAVGATPVLHWHGDAFEIPDGAKRLAETPGFPNQAFALDRHVLALQFHLEADPARIEQWLIGHTAELAAHGIDPAAIRRDAARHGAELAARGREVFAGWLDGLTR